MVFIFLAYFTLSPLQIKKNNNNKKKRKKK